MICVSIVSHGQAAIASRLLDCIERATQDTQAAGRTALITQVVYTRNVPEADDVLQRPGLPGLVVVDNQAPRGFGENHNAAFQHCQAPYFCVVNPDIEWTTDPFPALLASFGRGDAAPGQRPDGVQPVAGTAADAPGAEWTRPGPRPRSMITPQARGALGLTAPLIRSPGGKVENTARRLYTVREMVSQKLRPANHGPDAHWLAGMFLLFRADAYAQIGGFDERYFLYIEDVDICSRLRLAGWTLAQCPEAVVIHDARNTSHRSPRYMLWHLGGMFRYWTSSAFWRYRALLAREAERRTASGR